MDVPAVLLGQIRSAKARLSNRGERGATDTLLSLVALQFTPPCAASACRGLLASLTSTGKAHGRTLRVKPRLAPGCSGAQQWETTSRRRLLRTCLPRASRVAHFYPESPRQDTSRKPGWRRAATVRSDGRRVVASSLAQPTDYEAPGVAGGHRQQEDVSPEALLALRGADKAVVDGQGGVLHEGIRNSNVTVRPYLDVFAYCRRRHGLRGIPCDYAAGARASWVNPTTRAPTGESIVRGCGRLSRAPRCEPGSPRPIHRAALTPLPCRSRRDSRPGSPKAGPT